MSDFSVPVPMQSGKAVCMECPIELLPALAADRPTPVHAAWYSASA